MELLAFFFIFTLATCQAQSTVTEDLLQSQSELTIGHEFAELFLVQNRERLSNYIMIMEVQIIDQFMGAYELIKNKAIETRQAMDEFTEPSTCKDTVRARWELQVIRYGQKMSRCLNFAANYLKDFTGILNNLHNESRAYSVVVPNAGMNVLSRIDIFDGRDNLSRYISAEFRRLIFRSLDYYKDFEDFVADVDLDRDEYIRQLTACFRTYPRYFENESRQELEEMALCFSD